MSTKFKSLKLKVQSKLLFSLISFSFIFLGPVFSQTQDEEAFYVAEKAFHDGFYQASQTLFEKFVRDFPYSKKLCKAKLYIAKSLYFQKKYPQAQEVLKELEDRKEADEYADQIYYWLGQVYFEGKNYSQALDYAYKVINGYKSSSLYWWSEYLAGECYFKLTQYDSSEKIFQRIIKECKEDKLVKDSIVQLLNLYYVQENYSALILLVDTYFSRFLKENDKAKLLFYKGEGLFGRGQIDKAIKVFNQGLKLAKARQLEDFLYYRIGECWLNKDHQKRAKEYFDKIESRELKQFSYSSYYLKMKDYNLALEVCDAFLREFPNSKYQAQISLNKADCLYNMGRVRDALYFYQKVLTDFNLPELKNILDKAHYGLAWCYLKLGEFKKAIEEFQKTLKFTDNLIVRISSQIQIADAYQEKEMYDLALDTYNKILEEYPNNIYSDYIQFQIGMLFLKNNRFDEAKLSFRNLEQSFASSKLIPEAKYYLAASYFSEGNYQSAKDILESFLEDFPKHPYRDRVSYLYGKCFFNEGKYDKALKIFDKLDRESKDREIKELVLLDKAYAHLNLSDYQKAKATFKEFITRFPQSEYKPSVLLNLGALYERDAELARAQNYYNQIIKNYPNSPIYFEAMLAKAHLLWEEDKLADAETYLRQLTESKIERVTYKAKIYLGEILAQQGRTQEALNLYDSLIKLRKPISGIAMIKKASLLKELKDYKRAVVLFKEAQKFDLDEPGIYLSLGYCLEKLGKDSDALGEYFKIIYLFDDLQYKVKAYFRIARVYEKRNQLNEAKDIYREIIKLDVEEAKVAQEKLNQIERLLRERIGK
jgi:tetratricopeptide (TPR) repeat protein